MCVLQCDFFPLNESDEDSRWKTASIQTYDGLRKVVRLINRTEIIELPEGFSARLYHRIATRSDSVRRNNR